MSFIGYVKWFNSKKGYGFITAVTPDVEETGKDFFVHFSNIVIQDGSYKRLFPGEYVSFNIGKSDQEKTICTDVTGVYGGKLLAENDEYRYKIYPKNDGREDTEEKVEENVE
tara:strand:+ start:1321 stop:1656 length:336 start_codon:yes stop_codon:yes gene_type:complete